MDDDNSSTRLVACKVLSLLLQNGSSIFTGNASIAHSHAIILLHTMF